MPRGAPRRGPAAAETAAVRTVPTPPSGADPPTPNSRPRIPTPAPVCGPVPHSPCPGSCAPASVRARGEPRAGRAPGAPPSPPLFYPAGAAAPIARPLLCAGPDSMHASYSGGGAPAAPGARVSERGRGRAARSRGAPTAPDGRRGRGAAGAAPEPSGGPGDEAPVSPPPPCHPLLRSPPRVPPGSLRRPLRAPSGSAPGTERDRAPRAGGGGLGVRAERLRFISPSAVFGPR